MTKRQDDFLFADQRRKKIVAYFNYVFTSYNIELKFEGMHNLFKVMNLPEKTKNNILKTRISPSEVEAAMGLDYYLRNGKVDKKIPFLFAFPQKGGLYLKTPKEFLLDRMDYAFLLRDLDYHILICDEERSTFSYPLSMSTILNVFSYSLPISAGNKNRIQFLGPVSSITTYPVNLPTFFGEGKTVLDALQNLMK